MKPIVCEAEVTDSTRFGAYRILAFRAPEIAEGTRPGQFVMLAVQPRGACLLRRPFSIYRADGADGTVTVAFDAIGEGTLWLASRAPGDRLDVVGPLGHGFDIPSQPGVDVIVGGGYGTAALSFLAAALDERGGKVHAIIGARSRARIFEDDVLDSCCASIAVMTDDGSAGQQGLVTDPLPEMLQRFSPRTVYACGPMPMLQGVAEVSAATGMPSQLAVEEFMACGIGVCWTCVLPVSVEGSVKHMRSCTEGPVFEGAAIAWA